ncbi:histidine--tRNA ligase [Clostridium sp. OS1-26]|uniref:histidine--tRNA ligase n=1 Tax=Clostridium sp. OS1-26 TaxID=3070681 RepID=UPI0027DFE964|nr:histidine--tRNA ligase [Clostridium sp. OS1-26]WML34126.1 histidine--tRNA ligase [Clostridium sp. OS1-26]
MEKQFIKPSTLPGFMELLPADQIVFNNIMDIIRNNYEKSGFIPMDTPIIEKTEILLAKGGQETDKQIYRFTKGSNDISLRFDLTVPFARYSAQHMSDLTFPFRRYQIGKVFRGERNQKGRYREFYQCDIDIINNGELSIINDAEIPSIIYSIFTEIGLSSFKIRINNRKILNGFFSYLGISNGVEVLRIIDKVDKVGMEAVCKELKELGLDEAAVDKIVNFIDIKGSNQEILNSLTELNIENEDFKVGIDELSKVIHYIGCFGVPEKNYIIDLKIARGLEYYTGTVYETMLDDYPNIGSICSGGRYEDLAGHYTNQKLQGVGISIGLTRLFSQLRELGILKENASSSLTKVLVVPMGETMGYSVEVVKQLRENNIISEVYLENNKFNKKLSYANKLRIPFVIIIGEEEVSSKILTLKDMNTGEQSSLSVEEIINKVKL